MSTNQIGAKIAELRKARGLKQEDLANAANVSPQAVSKWECGGTPDAELLPLIADCLGVSIDTLFGREFSDYNDMMVVIRNYITPEEQEAPLDMHKAFAMCWAINAGLFGTCGGDEPINARLSDQLELIKNLTVQHNYDLGHGAYSRVTDENGITLVSLSDELPYFILMPEPPKGWRAGIPNAEKLLKAFAELSEPEFFNCLYFLHSKENGKRYSQEYFADYLAKEAAIKDPAKMLETLKAKGYLNETTMEVDDITQKFYVFRPNPIFLAILALMKGYIQPPQLTWPGMGGRRKAFLS